jgi:heptosyltransferase-2
MFCYRQFYRALQIYVLRMGYFIFAGSSRFVMPEPSSQRSILVVRSAALGDFIMSLPTLSVLRACYPMHRIVLLLYQSAARRRLEKTTVSDKNALGLPWIQFAHPHLIDEAIVMDVSRPLHLIRQLRPQIKKMNMEYGFLLQDKSLPGVGVGLRGILKNLAILRFLGVTCPIFGWRVDKPLPEHWQKQFPPEYLHHHTLAILRSACESPEVARREPERLVFAVRCSTVQAQVADKVWAQYELGGKTVIALAPGSLRPHKCWPIENFSAICRLLLARENTAILVIGTLEHEPLGDILVQQNPARVFNLAGQISIEAVAAILSKCFLLVGNDGGAIHLGDAVGCKVVSIVSGIESRFSVEPWHNIQHAVRHSVDCSPCYATDACPRGHNRCMMELPVAAVAAKISQVQELFLCVKN